MTSVVSRIVLGCSYALVFIASISIATSTFLMWYEPECPKELLEE